MICIEIDDVNEGGRLDKYLRRHLREASSGFIYKMLRKKNITLNNGKAAGNELLKKGDEIRLYFSDETYEKLRGGNDLHNTTASGQDRPRSSDLKKPQSSVNNKLRSSREDSLHNITDLIVYEDADILIADKPVGMLSQRNDENIKSLNEYCLEYLAVKNELPPAEDGFVPSICNRLDRNTSGLVIFAKSIAAARQISAALRERTIEKYYLALIKGHPVGARVCAWLKKDPSSNKVQISQKPFEGAVYIETVFENIRSTKRFSLLRLELVTGKPHQLRAQLSHEGFPILGDPKYGDMRLNRELKEKYGLTSQLLHACEIRLPELSGRLSELSGRSFTAKLPDIFERILGE